VVEGRCWRCLRLWLCLLLGCDEEEQRG
jgi:hypothetical protein